MAASDDQSKKLSHDCKEDDLCVQLKGSHRGGWITFPFISGNMIGTSVASTGAIANLVVYLIQQFNVRHIDAVQIANITNGSINLAPVAGAIISDSYFGCFPVVAISTAISTLGISLLTLTTTIHSLRPSPCPPTSSSCESASSHQFAVLYSALALIAIGNGGTRFNLATMGANQFRKAKDRDIFFNWFFFSMYLAFIVASTVVIYVEDNVSWGWGFGMCMAFNLISLGLFLTGRRYYRRIEVEGSPFTGLARVVVAAFKKRNVMVEPNYYYNIASNCKEAKLQNAIPTSRFSFLNRAALKVEGDTNEDGSIKHPWRLCTVEQVEDLKVLLRIFPLWSSAIFLSTPIGVQSNLSVLQALSMDRHVGPHFSIPAGSYFTFVLIAGAIALSLLDRFLYPAWHKLTGRRPTPLQRVGLGHVFNIMGMVSFALIESSRLRIIRSHGLEHQPGAVAPMSAHWLILPLLLVGAGEAFHFPGQVSLYYQEFPASLRSTASAMIALLIGIAFYLSSAITGLVQKLTGWLPDNINNGKLDNVYWMLAVVGAFNFGYYLVCAKLYKYQNAPKDEKDSCSESDANATALQSPRL